MIIIFHAGNSKTRMLDPFKDMPELNLYSNYAYEVIIYAAELSYMAWIARNVCQYVIRNMGAPLIIKALF